MQVLGHAAVGIAVLDRDGRIRQGNARLAQIGGRSLEELQSLEWSRLAHPEDWSWQRALVAEVDARFREAVSIAERTPPPPLESMFEDVYETPPWHLVEQRQQLLSGPRAPSSH